MRLHLIYARADNGTIGLNGQMPWHLPEDLAHFRQQTQGCPVIMGRKTWDSLPPRFRPLPGRQNIVITRQPGWSDTGALRAASLPEAVALCAGAAVVWVIGGAQIYAQAAPYAHAASGDRNPPKFCWRCLGPCVRAGLARGSAPTPARRQWLGIQFGAA
jgi:dihydrofolate reductase